LPTSYTETIENQYYWKNRKPDAAYWQQDVYCAMNAGIDEEDNRV
jgi:hypothetical protein